MNMIKLALVATFGVLFFACGDKTEADFSTVPVRGANGEYQYIDLSQKGKIVINPQFSEAHIFRSGLARVKASGKDSKWGYIDKKGNFAIKPIYSFAQDFSDGVAWVQVEGQLPTLIDKNGKTILQIDSLTTAYPFSNGVAGVKVYSEFQEHNKFIDKNGKFVAVTASEQTSSLFINDDRYAVQNRETGKWGYKNKKGEIVIKEQFDEAGGFINGIAVVKNGDKFGAIDKQGSFAINPQYDALDHDGDGLFVAKVDKKYGWINKKGEIVINPQFDNISGIFSGNKLVSVEIGNKWGYIDRTGQIVINPQFNVALAFNGDHAAVVDEKLKIGFIDKKGDLVVPFLYDGGLDDFSEYMFATMQNAYGLAYVYDGSHSPSAEDEIIKLSDFLSTKFLDYGILDEKRRFTDSRDGKKYKAAKIGGQIWMAENLNYETEGSACYNNNGDNCEKYGRLYKWATAMDLPIDCSDNSCSERVQAKHNGICPDGWHIPSKEEWDALLEAVGGKTAGKHLKSANGWNNRGNGTDDFYFTALPGGNGRSDGGFRYAGSYGNWLSTSEINANNIYVQSFYYDSKNAHGNSYDKKFLFSVRCVQGSGEPAPQPSVSATSPNPSVDSSANPADGNSEENAALTDSRDSKTYKTVKIGTQTWMAENLGYAADGSKCYGDDAANCEKYGRLYNWSAAAKACPAGWHLPKDNDFETLIITVGGSETAGKHLKAKTGWSGNNGADTYGFAVLPGGRYGTDGVFAGAGDFGLLWSALEENASYAYRYILDNSHERMEKYHNDKKAFLSVRCVQH